MELASNQNLHLVQGQLDAYNRRDLEAFCTYFHPEVEVTNLESGKQICQGIEAFKEIYRKRFDQNPDLHCQLRSRVILENSILDQEWVTGVTGQSKPSHLVAIYSFRDQKIDRVWFIF